MRTRVLQENRILKPEKMILDIDPPNFQHDLWLLKKFMEKSMDQPSCHSPIAQLLPVAPVTQPTSQSSYRPCSWNPFHPTTQHLSSESFTQKKLPAISESWLLLLVVVVGQLLFGQLSVLHPILPRVQTKTHASSSNRKASTTIKHKNHQFRMLPKMPVGKTKGFETPHQILEW